MSDVEVFGGTEVCCIGLNGAHLPDFVRNLDLNSRSADFSSAKGLPRTEMPSQHLPRSASQAIAIYTR